ncbi:hypothetical protein CR513_51718, partial [Mucuna pruriens]
MSEGQQHLEDCFQNSLCHYEYAIAAKVVVKATAVVEEVDDDDDAPLITRLNKRKTPSVKHQGTLLINMTVVSPILKAKRIKAR